MKTYEYNGRLFRFAEDKVPAGAILHEKAKAPVKAEPVKEEKPKKEKTKKEKAPKEKKVKAPKEKKVKEPKPPKEKKEKKAKEPKEKKVKEPKKPLFAKEEKTEITKQLFELRGDSSFDVIEDFVFSNHQTSGMYSLSHESPSLEFPRILL